jgi:pyruvate-formate lyase-activating enzyme
VLLSLSRSTGLSEAGVACGRESNGIAPQDTCHGAETIPVVDIILMSVGTIPAK